MAGDDSSVHYNQVTVIGTGLIGCSIASLLKGRVVADEVVGVDRKEAHLEMARRLGFVDRVQSDLGRGVMGSAAVILAVPLDEVFKVLDAIGQDVRPGSLVTCTAGSTDRLRSQLVRHVRSAENFVPSYPLVSLPGSGPGGAAPGHLDGQRCLVASGGTLPGKAVAQVEQLWQAIGMQVSTLESDRFESAVAGHYFWPTAVAAAAARVAGRGAWPEGQSPLTAWLDKVPFPKSLDRNYQLYAQRLCALLAELEDELQDLQRALGGSPAGEDPPAGEAP